MTNLLPQASDFHCLFTSASTLGWIFCPSSALHHVPPCVQSLRPGSPCRIPPGLQTIDHHLHRGKVEELEEHRGSIRPGDWRGILLQHEHSVRRASAAYAYPSSREVSFPLTSPNPVSRSRQQQPPEAPNATTQTLDSIKPRIREERAQSGPVRHTDPQTHTETEALNPADLEEEAGQEAAFDPETGEINWDCPCLGGMAHGPCGEEFKAAFSCFVYSKEEPKGMECIDKFKFVSLPKMSVCMMGC